MGKCAGKPCGINEIGPELVFRGAQEKCTHNPNEISAFASELVFRQVPGKFVQRRGYTERFGRARRLRRVALIDSIGGGVASVSATPTGLCLLAPGRLALGLSAGSLAVADSRVRSEPPPADPAGFLPGIGHLPSSSAVQMAHFCRAWVGRFSRVPKAISLDYSHRHMVRYFPIVGLDCFVYRFRCSVIWQSSGSWGARWAFQSVRIPIDH